MGRMRGAERREGREAFDKQQDQRAPSAALFFNSTRQFSPILPGADPKAVRRQADGTPNKTNIGANAILAVSLAVSKAGAAAREF